MPTDDAFFVPAADGYRATELTRGPWDPDSEHAGPPTALIAREIERAHAGPQGQADDHVAADHATSWLVGRITYEILRPVPIATLRVETSLVRPGRRVQHVEAVLRSSGEDLIRARSWLIRRREVAVPADVSSEGASSPARRAGRPSGKLGPPPLPGPTDAKEFFPTLHDVGYHTAMEYRFNESGFMEPGPATVWMRMRHPLVAGEDPTPLQRVLVAADSGNGVSATLDFRKFLFVNVDLTVQLHRMPAGEWVCLDAITVPEPTGLGMSDSALYDERGPIGRALQTLMITEREP